MRDTVGPARDLEADLAICEAATPGPWRWKEGYGLERMKLVGEFEIMNFGVGGTYDQVAGMEPDEDDAQFIAEAREGWPYAIRRAMAAEAEVDRLRNELNILHEQLEQRCARA